LLNVSVPSMFPLDENILGGAVGTLSGQDPDSDDTIIYTLSGDDAANFEVSGSTLKS
jgi:hypothetical protein